jgi:N utilization substance protein A
MTAHTAAGAVTPEFDQHAFVAEPDTSAVDLLDLFEPNAEQLTAATGTIIEATSDVALVRLADGTTATMPVTEFYPNKRWSVGTTVHVVKLPIATTSRTICSTTRPELIELLAAGVVPELRDGSVRIVRVARQVGIRSKIAVAATVPGVDPVGAFVGRAANRVAALSRMLMGERVDIVAWNPESHVFVTNALGVRVDAIADTPRFIAVQVPEHQLAAAVGGGGLNAQLTARITGKRISITATK